MASVAEGDGTPPAGSWTQAEGDGTDRAGDPCARTREGALRCWGDAANGALGDGRCRNCYVPRAVQR